ncbi:hypothetical protein RB595_009201 [Gaeumannomyces hyphopodioides]
MKRSREPEEESPASSPEGIASPPAYEMGPEPVPKMRGLDGNETSTGTSTAATTLRCTLHPHILIFATFNEYDAHYNKQHVNRCHECNKNFPSDHILSLHIEECHDSFVAALRDKGERTYSCFIEDCDRKCRDPSKRRRHLIDKHTYPPNFFFDVTRYGIDGRQSLLCDVGGHRRTQSKEARHSAAKASAAAREAGEGQATGAAGKERPRKSGVNKDETKAENPEPHVAHPTPSKDVEMEMDSLSSGMSSLKLVPRSISFGRGGRRAGFTRSH